MTFPNMKSFGVFLTFFLLSPPSTDILNQSVKTSPQNHHQWLNFSQCLNTPHTLTSSIQDMFLLCLLMLVIDFTNRPLIYNAEKHSALLLYKRLFKIKHLRYMQYLDRYSSDKTFFFKPRKNRTYSHWYLKTINYHYYIIHQPNVDTMLIITNIKSNDQEFIKNVNKHHYNQ